MQNKLPALFDPFQLARSSFSASDKMPIAKLTRLVPKLVSDQGDLWVDLVIEFDEQRICTIKGDVKGSLSLECQRCMQVMELPVTLSFVLGVVKKEERIDYLPESYEPLLVVDKVNMREILEEELLLYIPLVPKHDENDCGAVKSAFVQESDQVKTEVKRENPFSILKELK